MNSMHQWATTSPLAFLDRQAKTTDTVWRATTMARYAIAEAARANADKLEAEHEHITALDAPLMPSQQTHQG